MLTSQAMFDRVDHSNETLSDLGKAIQQDVLTTALGLSRDNQFPFIRFARGNGSLGEHIGPGIIVEHPGDGPDATMVILVPSLLARVGLHRTGRGLYLPDATHLLDDASRIPLFSSTDRQGDWLYYGPRAMRLLEAVIQTLPDRRLSRV